jgi:hypothetical protein
MRLQEKKTTINLKPQKPYREVINTIGQSPKAGATILLAPGSFTKLIERIVSVLGM